MPHKLTSKIIVKNYYGTYLLSICVFFNFRPNWQQQSSGSQQQHPWSALMAHQQAQRQQAQQAANMANGNSNNQTNNNTFSHQANPNDPSCTQGTMTIKTEKPENNSHDDCDGPPPAKMLALTQNLVNSSSSQNDKNSALSNQNHTSSGASSESGSHRSSSSESIANLSKINIKSEAGENSLNLSSLTMHHLLGLTQMNNNNNSMQQSSEKDTSGAESDGKVKSMDGDDFSKIISDLKANEGGGGLNNMENQSSDAIFKDLINSLPL